jgi:hypothetical protein
MMQLMAVAMVMAGQPRTLQVDQQFHDGETGCQAAGVQFSNSPEGPWETARPDEGPVRASAIPFDDRDESWSYPGVTWHEAAYVRVGAWPEQGLNGPPLYVTNPINPRVGSSGSAPQSPR